MRFRYAPEIQTIVVIVTSCTIFLCTSSIMKSDEYSGSDNTGSRVIMELSGSSEGNFRLITPPWETPSGEIEPRLFTLQAAVGGMLAGSIFSYWIGQDKKNQSGCKG